MKNLRKTVRLKMVHYICIWCSFILIICCIALFFKKRIYDTGLSDVQSITELSKLQPIQLEYIWDIESENQIVDSFKSSKSNIIAECKSADIIAIINPTGNLDLHPNSIGQEIKIKEILRGNEYATAGQKNFVYQSYGFITDTNNIIYRNTLNLMYPENEYLIFMNVSDLNQYRSDTTYILVSSDFGYINIEGTGTKAISADEPSFQELEEFEFFSASEKVARVINEIQKELLELYLE